MATRQTPGVRPEVRNPLPSIIKPLDQSNLQRYAEASGDHNPLHIDPHFAAATPFGGTIAHGMLLLAFVSEMLTAAFGLAWIETGRLKVRFRRAAPSDAMICVDGRVTEVNGERVVCDISCCDGAGDVFVDGTAEVIVR